MLNLFVIIDTQTFRFQQIYLLRNGNQRLIIAGLYHKIKNLP